MVIEIPDVWEDAQAFHEQYVRARVEHKFRREYSVGPVKKTVARFRQFVASNLDTIVDSRTKDFSQVIAAFNLAFPAGSAAADEATELAERVFNYVDFRDGNHSWSAYKLCRLARYKVCPYCHIAPAETQLKKAGFKGYRVQLDHYLPQSTFPYLGLSLGNLIPSCDRCNGPFHKHVANFQANPHLNPLKDKGLLNFKLRPANGGRWTPTMIAMREPFTSYEIRIDAPLVSIAAQNTLTTFHLESRYQLFVHDAVRVARVGLNRGWVHSILRATGLTLTVQMELGFPPADNHAYKSFPMGKMRRDVYLSVVR
ncbi:hypothetical protein [Paraburkholderia phenoliruptrix]|uniref:hypothetical protein n=1 Tax=Paraburkholderia phenoliruptrix TaxID=252970 RepID=UPI0034CD9748